MKKIIFLLLLFSKTVLAQDNNDRKVFLDSLENETPDTNYKYYRIIKEHDVTKDEYRIEDYYLSGKLKREGNSNKKEYLSENDPFVSYYENGNKKSIINFDNNYESGNCSFWYENGNKKLEGNYVLSGDERKKIVAFKIINYWDPNNVHKTVDGKGYFEDDGSYETQNENCVSSGEVLDGFKNGIWKGNHSKPNFSFTESYSNKKFISGTSIDSDGIEYNYAEIRTKAEPVKGMMDFYNHVKNKFYPPDSFRGRGKVLTEFVIDLDGKIVDLKII